MRDGVTGSTSRTVDIPSTGGTVNQDVLDDFLGNTWNKAHKELCVRGIVHDILFDLAERVGNLFPGTRVVVNFHEDLLRHIDATGRFSRGTRWQGAFVHIIVTIAAVYRKFRAGGFFADWNFFRFRLVDNNAAQIITGSRSSGCLGGSGCSGYGFFRYCDTVGRLCICFRCRGHGRLRFHLRCRGESRLRFNLRCSGNNRIRFHLRGRGDNRFRFHLWNRGHDRLWFRLRGRRGNGFRLNLMCRGFDWLDFWRNFRRFRRHRYWLGAHWWRRGLNRRFFFFRRNRRFFFYRLGLFT